jgi:hypothetical protein
MEGLPDFDICHVTAQAGAFGSVSNQRQAQRGGSIGRSSIVATLEGGKSVYYAVWLISCLPRPGTRPGGLGEIQAVTGSRHQLARVTVGPGCIADAADTDHDYLQPS